MSRMNPIVHLDERVFQKIMHWCRKAGNFEVSGLGNVIYDQKTNVFLVNEVYLLDQENTGTTSDIDEKALGKLMYEHHKSEIEGELKFWWHSHADMGVFWSTTDMATIKQLGGEGSFLSTVFNKKEEMRSAFYMTDPISVFVDELDTVVIQSFGDKDIEKHLAKMGLQIRPGKLGEFRWLVEPFLSDKEQIAWDDEYDKKVKEKKWAPLVTPSRFGPFGGRNFSHTPLTEEDRNDDPSAYVPKSDLESDFPDYVPKSGRFGLSEEDMEELMDEIEEFITSYPGSTREEVIEMFESEYPFISEIVHPNFKGLASE